MMIENVSSAMAMVDVGLQIHSFCNTYRILTSILHATEIALTIVLRIVLHNPMISPT